MFVKRSSLVLASLMALPSAAFALGLGDIRLLSPLNAPLDAEIELVDVTPEELQTLKAQIASRDTFTRYGLDWPVFLSSVQVKTTRTADGRQVIKLKSTDSITEPFITLLVEVNWARGRLVREYTMLLDPPVYTPGQPAANAPVAAPAAGAGAREGAIARGSQPPSSQDAPPASPTPPAQPTSPAPQGESAAPSSSHARTVSAPSASADASHLVKSGETLSSIAAAASGNSANSAQTRSWMLAIYQANPAAFDKNMNLLRSGAVLRIPESSDVSAISPSEANGEIRRQYAAWRSNAPATAGAAPSAEPGHLRLVTPTESNSAGSANAAETKALQGRVKELEGQLSESKRLLEMRNAELAQLQAKLQNANNAAAPTAVPTPPPPAPPVAAAPSAQTPPPASAEQQTPPAQAQAPQAAPPVAQEPAPAAEPTPAPAAEAARVDKPKPVQTAVPTESGGILDTVMAYWWAIALLAVAVLGFFGLRVWRSRRQSEFDDSLGRLAVAGAASMDRGFASGDTSPVRPLTAATDDGAFLVEESGTHERPRFPGGAAPAATARHVSTDETISSETAINLDQGDPLAEADFHMAYGLYDQAADLIRIAISREPQRRDLKLKLLEVFFVWGNKEQFLQSARELADTRAEAAPGEWEKIVIMGKQLAPDDPLFSGGGAVSGATAGGVDLDLEGGESRVDFDLLGEPVPDQVADGGVDLDIGSALGETTTETVTDRNLAIDTTINNINSSATGTTRQMTQKITREDVPLTPEFGSESEGPTVEQPQLDTVQNPTIRQKVAMALKQGHSAEQTAELAIDDLGLDLGALDTVDQPGLGASPDAPTLVAGMDERSRKVIEEARRRTAVSEEQEHDPGATAAWRMEDSDLHAMLGDGNGHAEENSQFDTSATAQLNALSDREVDFDLGDVDADGVGEADADGMHAHAANGAGLDLDVGTATVPDTAFTATQKLASDDLALPDLEPVTMSEVGTKLDLARAYMDMGDPEGARNILEEVMHEGSVAQKQEAQRLLESLPG
jgi:pilus assembly protein FimV